MPLHLGPSPTGGSSTPPLSDVATTATSSGALTIGKHNPADATSGNLTMTVADASGAGKEIAVSKKDATANTVTVSFSHLRDGGAGSITLVGQFEALQLVSKADGSWWPIGDHKTKAFLDATYSRLAESVNTVAASGSAVTLPDVTTATIHDVTLTANCTFTFPTLAAGKSFTVRLTQDATGGRTVTWPGTVKWSQAVAPVLSTGGGKQDILTFISVAGTAWSGFLAGLDMR